MQSSILPIEEGTWSNVLSTVTGVHLLSDTHPVTLSTSFDHRTVKIRETAGSSPISMAPSMGLPSSLPESPTNSKLADTGVLHCEVQPLQCPLARDAAVSGLDTKPILVQAVRKRGGSLSCGTCNRANLIVIFNHRRNRVFALFDATK